MITADNLIAYETSLAWSEAHRRKTTLIPACPRCGKGRTLFAHTVTQQPVIVASDFSHWCDDCRKSLAAKANQLVSTFKS